MQENKPSKKNIIRKLNHEGITVAKKSKGTPNYEIGLTVEDNLPNSAK